MYSRLDPIFKTRFRHAETLDTRQAIRHHDQPDGRSKDEEQEKEGSGQDLWEDQTSVSIRSLKIFLEQLVGTERNEKKKEDVTLSPAARAADTRENDHSSAAQQKATRAAQAYQRTYRATHSEEQEPRPDSGAIPSIALTPEEIRTIHKLIGDLDQLAERRVEHLTILKGESFLQSLVDAVKLHLSQ